MLDDLKQVIANFNYRMLINFGELGLIEITLTLLNSPKLVISWRGICNSTIRKQGHN